MASKYTRSVASFSCITLLACAASLGACADADPDSEPLGLGELAATPCSATPSVDPAKSLVVTESAALAKFPLQTVMSKLLAGVNDTGQSPLELYQRWWDSQNTAAGGVFSDAIHCDDQLTNGVPSINGYPIQCPRNEGILATSDPFNPVLTNLHYMKPVAIVNRFDLAPLDGSHCGEYRIIYAKQSGVLNPLDRNLIIFEATLPNPNPSCGLAGCRPVAEFWANLSTLSSAARAEAIKGFYFAGIQGFPEVLRPEHLGLPDASGARQGQIRTNQFTLAALSEHIWQLREFQLDKVCGGGGGCKLRFKPTTVKNNPYGELWNPSFADTRTGAFQSASGFLAHVPSLAPQSVVAMGMGTDEQFNAGESNSQTAALSGLENDYGIHLLLAGLNNSFAQSINAKLASIGRSDINAQNIADRATTQSCGGCHELSSGDLLGGNGANGLPLLWPLHSKPLSFVHVSETSQLSKPLAEVFIPHRKQILESYLSSTACGTCGVSYQGLSAAQTSAIPGTGGPTIGGSITH
ncbi:MAG TPA: hypothetical protein VE093_23490 [Polyangiaceae bacterium]|jgi:hypothetical protein|nr:hypothetical protein [Polyangiaceae bacterium]